LGKTIYKYKYTKINQEGGRGVVALKVDISSIFFNNDNVNYTQQVLQSDLNDSLWMIYTNIVKYK
jgi:hypothetical protein